MQGQRGHGGGLPEGLEADLRLRLRVLCVQAQHLLRSPRGSRWHAQLLRLTLEFFVNPRCLSAPVATEATTVEVDKSEAAKEPERSPSVEDQS